MCLAVPGEIVALLAPGSPDDPAAPLRTGRVSFGGIFKEICLAYVPEAQIGDYVLVHAGFAIARIDEAHARETLAALAALGLDPPDRP